jgi:dienelactone hydrolase
MRVRLLAAVALVSACSAVDEDGATGEDDANTLGDVAYHEGSDEAGDEAGDESGANESGGNETGDDEGAVPEQTSQCVHTILPRNDSEIVLCNELGQSLVASVAMPQGEPPPGGWPGVLILHGSGGSFMSGEEEEDPCLETLEYQFSDWAERFNERGYAVVIPASYYSRGFCEWNDDNRPDYLDKHEALILRTFDAVAAVHYLCDHPQIDCSRLGVLGFSAGGVVTLLMLNEDLGDAHDERLHDLEDIPPIVGAVAYYPGCGLEGEIINEIDEADVERYFYPRAPILVSHAEKDKLVDDCEEVRDPQVDVVAAQKGVTEDMFELDIYDGAKHGFDGTSQNGKKADFDASVHARAKTLAKFDEWFF